MALDVLRTEGSGAVALRIVIEGIEAEFVSDPAMEVASDDGRTRVYCLNLAENRVVIDESVNLPDAVLEISNNNIKLFETDDEDVSRAIWHGPSLMRYLDGTITRGDTTLTLLSTDGISDGDYLHIGTECIQVGTVASATTLTDCIRGQRDSLSLKWWANVGSELSYQVLTDQPQSLRGRHVYVYAYDDGDDLEGDGRRVWTGLVTSEPRIADGGTTYSFSVGSIAESLDADIGGSLGATLYPRGAYYPWSSPLVISITEVLAAGGANNGVHYLTGFYETQNDFVEALSTILASPASFNVTPETFGCEYRAIELADGTWTIEGRVDAPATYDAITFQASSPCDGKSGKDVGFNSSSSAVEFVAPAYTSGELVYPVWTSDLGGARQCPRGSFGGPPDPAFEGALAQPRVPLDQTIFPSLRIYVDGALETGTDAAQISWPGGGTYQYIADIGGLDLPTNSITLTKPPALPDFSNPHIGIAYAARSLPDIEVVRNIAFGTLSDFREALIEEAREYASRGTAPLVTVRDLASWLAQLEVAPSKPYLKDRMYQFGEPTNLKDCLAAEFKLHSMYPVIDSSGAISIKPLTHPNPSDPSIVVLDDELITVDWSSIERGNQTYNAIKIERGWSAIEERYTLGPITVRDVRARSLDQRTRTLNVSPKVSSYGGDEQINGPEAAEIFMPWLGLFGYPHDFVTVQLPWTHFDSTLLGQTVSFSADHLPDYRAGRRPLTSVAGVVVGRRWSLGEAHGTIRILISRANVAGYTPSARVTATNDLGSNLWELTVSATKYAPLTDGGTVAANTDTLYSVGDKVYIVEYDDSTPATVLGTVTAINTTTHVINVQFDAVFTPGAATWELEYQAYDDVQETQRRFAFVAGPDGLLDNGTSNDNARVFAA